ncbi:MAG: glycosyltransferase family 4 protein [Clostridiales bacterium]|nr:glycosyltransferase family 4 protein [Clostridiales bacterium]
MHSSPRQAAGHSAKEFRKKMKSRYRVIVLGAIPPPYMGPTLSTEVILNSKLKNEFDLIHLDTSDHRDLNRLNRVDLWNFLLAFKHYFMLVRSIFKHWPSLIYIPICQTTLGYFRDAPFIVIGKIFNRKILCHLRGGNFRNWYSSSGALTRWVVRRVHSLIDGQIVLGQCLRNLFEGILPERKIFTVSNGKNVSFDQQKKENPDKIKILFLSNFIREKGILDVLESIPIVYRHEPRVVFIFAGDWFDRGTKIEVENFLKNNKELPVQIKGPIFGHEKVDVLSSCDIFVFPPYQVEGHPWVIIEAMAAGLPIISTDQGAITESVIDGVNGFIVEKRNPYQIAEKIKFLIENSDIRKKMGEESRRLYLENFTEEKMIERLSCVFNSVLSQL